jgi:ribosomal protein L29
MKIKLLTTKELRTKKPAEIQKYVKELQTHRIDLIEKVQAGKEKTTHQLKQMKRSIATALTVEAENSTKEKKEEK